MLTIIDNLDNFYPKVLPADSAEYGVLYNAAKKTAHLDGMSLEIGLRRGGGLESLVEGYLAGNPTRPRLFVSVDPYGNIDYAEGNSIVRHDYTNVMKITALSPIYKYIEGKIASGASIDYQFHCLEDTEFFARFANGVPCLLYTSPSPRD